jgi:hypothetical protein
MRTLRIVAVLALALAGFSAVLVSAAMALGYRSPVFGFCVVGATLGLIVVTLPVVRWRLPESLVRADSRGVDATYRALGVTAFGALLRRPPLRWFNSTVYVRDGAEPLAAARDNMLAAEAAHFWALVLTLPFLAWLAWHGAWPAIASMLATHAVLNVYPALHLRLMRVRIEPLIERRAGLRATRVEATPSPPNPPLEGEGSRPP